MSDKVNQPCVDSLRDQFAAAALAGLIVEDPRELAMAGTCRLAWQWADAMLAERDAQKLSESDSSRTVGDTSQERVAPSQHDAKRGDSGVGDAFHAAVMHWISEATSQIVTLLEGDRITEDDLEVMRQIMVDACDRCWTTLEKNHDAVPAARAETWVKEPSGNATGEPGGDQTGNIGTGKQTAPPCVETDGFSPGSRTGQINRTPERQSPARECEESQPRDVTQPDNGLAAGGPGHNTPEPVAWAVYWNEADSPIYFDEPPSTKWSPMPRVVPLYAHPTQDRVVRLPSVVRTLDDAKGYDGDSWSFGWACAITNAQAALAAAGVKWEVGE